MMTKKMNKSILVVGLISVLTWAVSFAYGENPAKSLKGKVYFQDQPDLSLAKRLELARKEFQSMKKGEQYLTGYSFEGRHRVHIDRDHHHSIDSYRVKLKNNEICISRATQEKEKTREHLDIENGPEPLGIIFLNKISKDEANIIDAHLLDFENTYEFQETPLFWLGSVESDESISFLADLIEDGSYELRKDLVFVCSLHNSPKVYDTLKGIALGKYETKIRKNAIFWLGTLKDKKSIDCLKDLSKRIKDTELRKQIVFAFQLSDEDEAMAELIRMAKTESNREVKENAIFWLGQKASKECIKALKEVVEESEDIDLKGRAVFAISQLPRDKAVPMLIDIAKTNQSPSVRKKAMFWLGQTGDERALKFFEEILLKK